MSTDGLDDQLEKSEQLDSDEIRNNDGDEVVDPPERWIEPKDEETLAERLSDEEPDVDADDADDSDDRPSSDAHDADEGGGLEVVSDDDLDHLDPEQHGRARGQIDGTPEDGDSFFDVIE
jgi:hypothetical protein